MRERIEEKNKFAIQILKNIPYDTNQRIIHEKLHLRKVYDKWVLYKLTDNHRNIWIKFLPEILEILGQSEEK